MSEIGLEVGRLVRTPAGIGMLQGFVYNMQLRFAVVDLWPAAPQTILRPEFLTMTYFPADVVEQVMDGEAQQAGE
jgi:hypothetical protein